MWGRQSCRRAGFPPAFSRAETRPAQKPLADVPSSLCPCLRITLQNPHNGKDCVPIACSRRHAEQLVDLPKIADRLHVAAVHSKNETVFRPDHSHEPIPVWRKIEWNVSRTAAGS